jgi:hypothetical protein
MLSTDFILMRRLRLKLDLVPGPPHDDETLYNQAIQVIARYPAQPAAAALSAVPGVAVVTDGSRDPRAWQWVWRGGDRLIRVGFAMLHKQADTDAAWGGSTLEADCFVGDLLGLWAQFRQTHPDTWMHYDGRVFTPTGLIGAISRTIENYVVNDLWNPDLGADQ